MTCAYDEIYLEDAMRNLGEMTEYAHDACGIDPDRAMEYFLISRYADRFAAGDPAVICGLSGTELFIRSAESCHAPIGDWPDPIVRYATTQANITGSATFWPFSSGRPVSLFTGSWKNYALPTCCRCIPRCTQPLKNVHHSLYWIFIMPGHS